MNGVYTAAELLTIIAAIGVLITGVGAVIVNVIVALRTAGKLDLNLKKTEGLSHQVQEVHTLTNSNLSAVKAELATALAQITALRDLVQDMRNDRQAAALAVALATPAPHQGDRRASAPLGPLPLAPISVIIENQPGKEVPVVISDPEADRADP